MTYRRNYCTECEWSASTKNHDRHELNTLVIGHFTNTNHTIESEPILEVQSEPIPEIKSEPIPEIESEPIPEPDEISTD